MYTYNELKNIEAIREAKREEIRAQLADIERKRREAETDMRMAAAAMDKKAFLDAENEQRALEAQLGALRDKLANPAPVERENILLAWNDYADEYNQTFDKKLEAYTAARKKAAALYLDLAKAQGAALVERDRFARMLGADPAYLAAGFSDLPEMARLHLLQNGHETRVSAYTGGKGQIEPLCYILTGDLPRWTFAGLKQIVDSRLPASINPTTLTGTAAAVATSTGLTI